MARKTTLQPGARRLLDLRAAGTATGQPQLVAEYQLQQSRHTPPRYRVAHPVVRNGKPRGWTGHSPWTADRALAERWLADKREAMVRNWRANPPKRRRKRKSGPSYDNVIRGASLLGPGLARIVSGGLPGLGKRR